MAIAAIGLLAAAIGAWKAFDCFIQNGVGPDFPAGYAVVIFALVLGAFGLIAVKVDL